MKGNTIVRKNIEQLQYQLLDTFKKQFSSDDASDIARILADKLSRLDPRTSLQSVTHAGGEASVVLLISLIFNWHCLIGYLPVLFCEHFANTYLMQNLLEAKLKNNKRRKL